MYLTQLHFKGLNQDKTIVYYRIIQKHVMEILQQFLTENG